jgi:cytochrome d ubiquinol oxidase subunit II
MLIGLILRGVAFELRVKASGWHQEMWNRLFFVGSLGAAIAQGVMLAGVVTGFRGGILFTAFDLLVGIGLAGAYALLGATWLVIKTEGDLHAKALRWSALAVPFTALGVGAISLATPFASPGIMDKWFTWPRMLWLSPLPLLTAAAFAGIWISVARLRAGRSRIEWLPFVLAVWVFVFAFGGLAYSLYPYLVVDRMTIWQAAAARESLWVVFIGTCLVLPLVIGYTVLSYRVFWGKAKTLTYGA